MSARCFPACLVLGVLVLALPATALEQCVDDGTTLACVLVEGADGHEQGVFLFDGKTSTTGHAVARNTTTAEGRTTSVDVSARPLNAHTVVLTLALTDATEDGQPERGHLAFAARSAGGAPLLAADVAFSDTDGDGRPDADGFSWRLDYVLP